MSEKHTPGPWEASRWRVCKLEPLKVICDTAHNQRTRTPENEANAKLIAAAPDLLAACEAGERALTEIVEAIQEFLAEIGGGKWTYILERTGVIDQLRAAIQRAKPAD